MIRRALDWADAHDDLMAATFAAVAFVATLLTLYAWKA